MEPESSSSVLISARHQILKKLFKSEGVRRLLVPSSREDFNKTFDGFTEAEKDALYHLFQNIVVESLPYNIEIDRHMDYKQLLTEKRAPKRQEKSQSSQTLLSGVKDVQESLESLGDGMLNSRIVWEPQISTKSE